MFHSGLYTVVSLATLASFMHNKVFLFKVKCHITVRQVTIIIKVFFGLVKSYVLY